jgi:ribosomal protein S18 acetylase RimI-like enzyme
MASPQQMDSKLEIRQASIDDAEEILKIQKEAYWKQGEIYQNFQIRPLTQTLDTLKDEFAEKTFLVALINGQVISSVRFWQQDDIVQIERISVKPEVQNQGIGMMLLLELEKYCPQARAFELFTGAKSLRNIHVYEKLGYVVTKKKDDGQGILTLYMRKEVCAEMKP